MSEQNIDAEIVMGREVPYSQLGDWVNHSGVSDRAARVYWTLSEHLNAKRGDREVWPAQSTLAKVLGIKRAADVTPVIDELTVIGAVEVRVDYEPSGRRSRNRYVVHGAPSDDYKGPRSLAEFYRMLHAGEDVYDKWFAARRKEIRQGVQRLQAERQEADRRAKERAKSRARGGAESRTPTTSMGGAESRTPTRPAETQNDAGRWEVRDSAWGGAGSRTAEVRDPAPKQDELEQDEEKNTHSLAVVDAPAAGAGVGSESSTDPIPLFGDDGPAADGQQDDGFDAFWAAYPRKVGKGAARRAFAAAVKRGVEPEKLLAAVAVHAARWSRERTEARFIPHPTTWLNAERYEDEVPAASSPAAAAAGGFRPWRQVADESEYHAGW